MPTADSNQWPTAFQISCPITLIIASLFIQQSALILALAYGHEAINEQARGILNILYNTNQEFK
jgi:hypothetical protein